MNFFTPDFIQNCISRKRTKKLQHDLLRKKINTQEGKKQSYFETLFLNLLTSTRRITFARTLLMNEKG